MKIQIRNKFYEWFRKELVFNADVYLRFNAIFFRKGNETNWLGVLKYQFQIHILATNVSQVLWICIQRSNQMNIQAPCLEPLALQRLRMFEVPTRYKR